MAQRPPWIDPRLRELPPRPWRKIHLDFHNSQHIPRIGERFDPDEFGDTLLRGHVDAVVVFAKDMHGFFYYPTRHAPRHPGLEFDLLGQQVAACHSRGIKVYAYYCVTWDNYLAEQRPEWLVWTRNRTTYLPRFDEPPGWTALCLTNEDFVGLVLDHSAEILERYDLDGIWYDMPLPRGGECFCRNCLAALRAAGQDPFDTLAQRRHKQELLTDFMRRAHEQAHRIRPGCQVDQNNQTRLGLGARAPYMDNIDIEALPTAFWGYLYFPANVRYARTFGRSVAGMSGRFHRSWADFGGLKHVSQLRSELPAIVAQGAQCDLGDQLPPSGRLDLAVYETIGQAYAEVERLEPFLERAVPVTEAAIVVSGAPLEDIGSSHPELAGGTGQAVYGLTRLLMECRVQFDIVEPDQEIERYRLLVLPDGLAVDEPLAARLRAYLAGGGALIAAHSALRLAGTGALWAEELGLEYRGESPFAPAYLKLLFATEGTDRTAGKAEEATPEVDRTLSPASTPRSRALVSVSSVADIWRGLPDYEYALYDGAAQWLPRDPSAVVARLGEPLFQRSAAHYTSHAQTPFDHLTDYAAAALRGRLAAVAFPLGASYHRHGYWIYREVFRRLLGAVLPERLVESDAPLSAELALTHQASAGDRPERWMVHLVNFSPNRRSPEHCEYLEDPIPLRDVRVLLRAGRSIVRAYLAASGAALPLRAVDGGWETVVPRVDHGQIVVFEESQ
ncbi:MAG TPA: alpha-amylase family protein [Roseiflexaceae bacterium]|nr:alpha-amylase family protein [Roseiflexaceae bacterium]